MLVLIVALSLGYCHGLLLLCLGGDRLCPDYCPGMLLRLCPFPSLWAFAFALALGNLRKIHMPIQTLLIDEGFGNLDHQSADMVVSGLESLKQKNIQVGLISHVQTLQERIAARISVNDLFLSPQRVSP